MGRVRVAVGVGAACVVTVVAGSSSATNAAPPDAAPPVVTPGDGPLTWLASGDSFSSGEGIQRTSGDCAQSPDAYGPRAARLLREVRGYEVDPVALTACTGAVAGDFFNQPNKSHPTQTVWAGQLRAGGRFDVVTTSFGGNDVDFGAVVKGCLDLWSWGELVADKGDTGCNATPEGLSKRISRLIKGAGSAKNSAPFGQNSTPATLAQFYTQIAQAHLNPGGTLVVVGYPRLIAPSDQWPSWRHGMCGQITAADADMLGDAAQELDQAIAGAATEANDTVAEGLTITYVSRFDLFDDEGESRSLCARGGTSWMNGVASIAYAGRVESPFHPNRLGHLATAEVVAARVNKVLELDKAPVLSDPDTTVTPAVPAETSEAPITDGSSTYEIGTGFTETCSVAWPTAPVRLTDSIQMTMSCPNVPGQFLFVSVIYPDPDLPINPSTGASRVEGEVVDVAVSAYGYKTLVVAADTIDLGSGW